jgi:AbrB family looped-hinge helix DNA binding protein
MQTTIDRAGRIVVPKALRDQLRLHAGSLLDITERDGVLEIVPLAAQVTLRSTPEGPVAVPVTELPSLTDADVRDAIDTVRR